MVEWIVPTSIVELFLTEHILHPLRGWKFQVKGDRWLRENGVLCILLSMHLIAIKWYQDWELSNLAQSDHF